MIRLALVGLLVVVFLIVWARGEFYLHRRLVSPYVLTGLWRLFVLGLAAVSVVTIAGLWQAQDAGEDARSAARRARGIAQELCEQTLSWQRAVLEGRIADVRIAEFELRIAENERDDAQTALSDAINLIGTDEPPSPPESFFRAVFQRDLARAQNRVEALSAEALRRTSTLAELQETSLTECPPIPAD